MKRPDDDSETDIEGEDESNEQLEETDEEDDGDEDEERPKLSFMSGAALSRLPRPRPEFATPKERLEEAMPTPPKEIARAIVTTYHTLERKLGRAPGNAEIIDATRVPGATRGAQMTRVYSVLKAAGLKGGGTPKAPPPPPSSSSAAVETNDESTPEVAQPKPDYAPRPLRQELHERREAALGRMLEAAGEIRAIDVTLATIGESRA